MSMYMPRIFGISKPGGGKKFGQRLVNEDCIGYGMASQPDNCFAFVMDGATGIGEFSSIDDLTPAEWYVQKAQYFLRRNLTNHPGMSTRAATRWAASCTAKKFETRLKQLEIENLAPYDLPSAGLALCRKAMVKCRGSERRDAYWEFLMLGDVSAAVKFRDQTVQLLPNENAQRLKELDESVIRRMVEISLETEQDEGREPLSVIETMSTPEIQAMLRTNRATMNTPDGYWVLGLDEDAVKHASFVRIPYDNVERIVLYSDGLDYEILGLSVAEMVGYCANMSSLMQLYDQIRSEEYDDFTGTRRPRFKQSDDLSVVVIDCSPL